MTPLHTLLTNHSHAVHRVYHNGTRFILWPEFAAQVITQANVFRTQKAQRWLLVCEQAEDFLICLLALLYAGKNVVIPPNTQPGTITQLTSAFDAVTPTRLTALAQHTTVQYQNIAKTILLPPLDPTTTRIDLYTSGSTGVPKKISKTLRQCETEVALLESVWGHTLGQSTVIATVPHSHFYGLIFHLLWPLSAGRTFDTTLCRDPSILLQRLTQLDACTLISSPAHLTRLPELIALPPLVPKLKYIFSSGAALPAKTTALFKQQLHTSPTEIFGSTETGVIAWRIQDVNEAWTPLPGLTIGCTQNNVLTLRSPLLPDNTLLWHTDDAITHSADGRFILRGRLDRTVKIAEKRLSLPEMEAHLCTHPWVLTAAVVVLTEPRARIAIAAVLSEQGKQQYENAG
ncbi:MAG: acyl--CoA ligase, partial [Ottowia sp.]|nr:acyl--CoA ligase [Ottowia sp.]